jgi:DNA-binding GntR family transcriptional regulator
LSNRRRLAPSAADPSLREQAYAAIKAQILDSHYTPGSMLSETQLAGDLNISRTPIREALRQLAINGLVEILPKRGVMISRLTLQDVVEVYQLREQLECFATRLAAVRLSPDDIAGFKSDHDRALSSLNRGRLREAYDYSVLMHQRIVALAGNSRLTQFMQQLSDQVHRFGLLTLRHGRAGPALAEHGAIIQAMCDNDGTKAETLMRTHLREDRNMVLRLTLPAGLEDEDALPVLEDIRA